MTQQCPGSVGNAVGAKRTADSLRGSAKMLRDWDGMMSSPDLDLRICNAVHTCQLCCVCVGVERD